MPALEMTDERFERLAITSDRNGRPAVLGEMELERAQREVEARLHTLGVVKKREAQLVRQLDEARDQVADAEVAHAEAEARLVRVRAGRAA